MFIDNVDELNEVVLLKFNNHFMNNLFYSLEALIMLSDKVDLYHIKLMFMH